MLTPMDLVALPGVLRHLHPSLVKPFIDTAGRLASNWLADQSDLNLSHILGLVKVGLSPAMRHGHAPVIARLAQYPRTSLPEKPPSDARLADPVKTACSLVEAGFIGKAERALNDDSRVAPINEETITILKSKQPAGTVNPFETPLPPSLPFPDLPEESRITKAISVFAPDTAPGPSGWTVGLLRLAAKSPEFLCFLVTLTGQIAAGTAPGRDLLCAARLTPLIKPDGGIRPIAVGELFYRLAMKAIFASNFRHDLLSPHQFGVGSKGGVEPIVQAIRRAAKGDPLFPYSHLFALDSVNAFNTLRRHLLAKAVQKRSPALARLAAWAHNNPSQLLLHDTNGTTILSSEEGVRQGDPMSTLWFSLAIRDTVEGLRDMLGPTYLVLAYLDDIFILAPNGDRLIDILAHFDTQQCPVRLNPAKCKTYDLSKVDSEPIKVLGSCIGSQADRAAFLLDKVVKVEADLANLHLLPRQYALLLLRKSIQHKLRHLSRHLQSDDLPELWHRLDASLWTAVDKLRGHIPSEVNHKRDRCLLSLPPALGGCGVTSHLEVSPLAYKAAHSLSTTVLRPLVPRLELESDTRSQRELSQEAALIKQELLLASLDSRDQITITESASQVGRRWLDVTPSSSRLVMSDADVMANLHHRTLLSGYPGNCQLCASPNLPSHDEACRGRQDFRISRHESVKHIIASGLRGIPRMQVEVEPFLPNLRRRNDIRITFSDDRSPLLNEEYDLKVMVLSAATNQRSLSVAVVPNATDTTIFKRAAAQIQTLLAQHAKKKVDALPARDGNGPRPPPFYPLVMSSGGMLERSMFEKVKQWRGLSSRSVSHSHMLSCMAVSLAKARGRTFVL
jgi:hypothetical protein